MRMDDKWINTVSNDGQQPNQVGQARQHTPEKNQLLNVHSCFTLKQPGNVRKKTVDEVKKAVALGSEENSDQRAGAPFMKKGGGSWVCSVWRREGPGKISLQPSSTCREHINRRGD